MKETFDHLVKKDERKYDNIQKFTNGHRNNCATDCFLDYPYFKKHYKMIAIDLGKQ